MDFYRELADVFGVPLAGHNRWASFKALRQRWGEHIASTLARPVLSTDEAQEALTTVFNELRILASKDLDSRQSPRRRAASRTLRHHSLRASARRTLRKPRGSDHSLPF
jgi:hypothetical protein